MNMPEPIYLDIDLYGDTYRVQYALSAYNNGHLAISLWSDDEGPFADVTVNMPNADLPDGMVFVKNWSENAAVIDQLVARGDLVPDGSAVMSGMVMVPRMRPAGDLRKVILRNEYNFNECCAYPGESDERDCLERATCEAAGQPGHGHCGWCSVDNKPTHRCSHQTEGNH